MKIEIRKIYFTEHGEIEMRVRIIKPVSPPYPSLNASNDEMRRYNDRFEQYEREYEKYRKEMIWLHLGDGELAQNDKS